MSLFSSLSLPLFLSLLPSFLPSLFISSVFLPHSSSLHVSPLPPQASLFPSSQLLGSSVLLSSISLPLPLSATRTTKMMHRHTTLTHKCWQYLPVTRCGSVYLTSLATVKTLYFGRSCSSLVMKNLRIFTSTTERD